MNRFRKREIIVILVLQILFYKYILWYWPDKTYHMDCIIGPLIRSNWKKYRNQAYISFPTHNRCWVSIHFIIQMFDDRLKLILFLVPIFCTLWKSSSKGWNNSGSWTLGEFFDVHQYLKSNIHISKDIDVAGLKWPLYNHKSGRSSIRRCQLFRPSLFFWLFSIKLFDIWSSTFAV